MTDWFQNTLWVERKLTKSRHVGRGGHNKIKIDDDLLAQFYDQGGDVRQIAMDFGVSVGTIYNRLKNMKITRTNSESHKGQKPWNRGLQSPNISSYRVITVEGKQVRDHRYVMEQYLGRSLRQGEVVHHKNGNRFDNRVQNLELCASQSEHMKGHSDFETMSKRGRKGAEARWTHSIESKRN